VTARTVEIATPSARDELISVVRSAMGITAVVWLYLANNPFPEAGGGTLQRNLLPFQKVVQTLPPAEQRTFRELQVALLEAETIRSTEEKWPEPDRLAMDGIEPFALNPALKTTPTQWSLVRNGLIFNYVGIPREPGVPAWLVVVQEPDPALPPEAFVEDEEHDRLIDGSVLHVSIWNHPNGSSILAKPVQVPQAEGWSQLYAADPSAGVGGDLLPR
jgi:hypothetical protein